MHHLDTVKDCLRCDALLVTINCWVDVVDDLRGDYFVEVGVKEDLFDNDWLEVFVRTRCLVLAQVICCFDLLDRKLETVGGPPLDVDLKRFCLELVFLLS